MRPQKICIIGPAYPLRGGLASFNERLAYAYQENGHTVKLYTFSLQYPAIFFPGKTQISEDPAPKNLDIEVCINSVNPFNWLSIGRRINKENFDLIIVRFWIPFMGPSLGTILRRIKRNGKTKIVGLIDNIIPHEKRIGDTILAQYFVNAVDGFVVMSRAVEQEMQGFVKQQKVSYVPHPIYDIYGDAIPQAKAKERLQLEKASLHILFFGFIRAYKGLDILIEAMSHQVVKDLNLKLVVAGEYYDQQEKYESQITALRLSDSIILHTHFISNEEVVNYFSAADLVVQPYRTATQSGISQIAYHFEKPMVVTNVGGLPEIVDHQKNGYVVPVQAGAIANAIGDFFNQNKSAEFTQAVKEKKKEFSWSNFMNAIDNL